MAHPLCDISRSALYGFPRVQGTPVILGEKNDAALLGVITIEEFGLTFNPFERTLQPARMMLAAVKEEYDL